MELHKGKQLSNENGSLRQMFINIFSVG